MNATLRARLRILVIVILAAFALSEVPFALAEVFFVQQTTFGFDYADHPAQEDRRGAPKTLLVAVFDPRAAKAGLHDGDRLEVAQMSDLDRVKLFSDINWPVGTTLALKVSSRGSATRTVELRAFPDDPIDIQRCFAVWSQVALAFLWVLVGAMLVATRPSVMTWGFYLFCIGHHPFRTFGIYLGPPWVAASIFVGFAVLNALGYAGIIAFAARFSRGKAEGGWRYFELAALPVFLSLLAIYLYDDLPMLTGRPDSIDTTNLNEAIICAVAAAVLVALFVKLLRLHGQERASMAWVLAGYAGCNAGIAAWTYQYSLSPGTPLRYAVVAFSILGHASLPLFVGYAVVWYRAFA